MEASEPGGGSGLVQHEVGREIVVEVKDLQKYFGRNHVPVSYTHLTQPTKA